MSRRVATAVVKGIVAAGGSKPAPKGLSLDIEIQGMDQIMQHLDDLDEPNRYEIEVGLLDKKHYPGKDGKKCLNVV